jgi:pimeloyl-ACP methyl ester carboxylesterase
MALDRHPASGKKIGSLVVNPGGPGVSGVDALPGLVAQMPKSLQQRFDVVSFDPPGVGRTAPIDCLDSQGLSTYFNTDPEPQTPAGLDALIASDRTFGSGCLVHSRAELPFVSTVAAARDMDIMRQDLGDAKLTYLGYSYGTLIGAVYAELFPTHVRALVLDGVLNPALPVITDLEQQAASLDTQLQQFFAWCAGQSRSSCPWKPGDSLGSAFQSMLSQSRANPLPVQHSPRTAGPAAFLYGTAAALYDTSTWTDLAISLDDASRGDGTDLLKLFDAYTERSADGSYGNLFEANEAINCLDAPSPSVAQFEAAAAQAKAAAPVFGLQNLYSGLGCAVWPIPATGTIGPIHANGAPPILVVGSTGDPITPYAWAQSLAGQLQHGVLLTRVGDGHTAYRASSCIRDKVDRYLIDLAVPPPGTRCQSG